MPASGRGRWLRARAARRAKSGCVRCSVVPPLERGSPRLPCGRLRARAARPRSQSPDRRGERVVPACCTRLQARVSERRGAPWLGPRRRDPAARQGRAACVSRAGQPRARAGGQRVLCGAAAPYPRYTPAGTPGSTRARRQPAGPARRCSPLPSPKTLKHPSRRARRQGREGGPGPAVPRVRRGPGPPGRAGGARGVQPAARRHRARRRARGRRRGGRRRGRRARRGTLAAGAPGGAGLRRASLPWRSSEHCPARQDAVPPCARSALQPPRRGGRGRAQGLRQQRAGKLWRRSGKPGAGA